MNLNLITLANIKMIVKTFPIKRIQIFKDEIVIYIDSSFILYFLVFLKYHHLPLLSEMTMYHTIVYFSNIHIQ